MQVKNSKLLFVCLFIAIIAITLPGCGKNKEALEKRERERAVIKAFYASQVPIDDQNLEFSWAGYRWRVPRYFRAAEVGYTETEVDGFYISAVWQRGKLLVYGDPAHHSTAATDKSTWHWHGVGLMPQIKYEDYESNLDRYRSWYGKPVAVPGIAYVVYPDSTKSTVERLWQATELKDRMSFPIEFSCNISMDKITSGQISELPNKLGDHTEQCEGVLMVRSGFGVRYRFYAHDLPQSLQLVESIMDLFDSWIIEE